MKLDNVFGIHEQALKLRIQRSEMLASNLVNSETPGYKARDFDFHKVLRQTTQSADNTNSLSATHRGHIKPLGSGLLSPAEVKFRIPQQASLDGNTVDMEKEQVAFGENAVQYQASLRFLDGKIKNLMTAIKGGS